MRLLLNICVTSLLTFTLSGCVIGNQFGHSGQNVNVTLGNIEVKDGEQAGHLETVNGNIEIGQNTTVRSAETVNGNISVGANSQTGDLETVNGSLELGESVVVDGTLETVNGDITIEADGKIKKSISLTNGDVVLAARVEVEGDIIFEHSSWSSMFDSKNVRKLEISESAIVNGKIYLYAPVELVLPSNFDLDKIERRFKGKK